MSKRRRDARRAARRAQLGNRGINPQGMSQKQIKALSDQINTETIENVIEVIVKTEEEEIILKNPEVTIMNMGQELWNIVPTSVERRKLSEIPDESNEEPIDIEIKEEDVQLIAKTANVSEKDARNALEKSNGDIAKAIMMLK